MNGELCIGISRQKGSACRIVEPRLVGFLYWIRWMNYAAESCSCMTFTAWTLVITSIGVVNMFKPEKGGVTGENAKADHEELHKCVTEQELLSISSA